MRPPMVRLMENSELVDNGCWLWTGYVRDNGYGSFGYKPGGGYSTPGCMGAVPRRDP